MFGMLIFVYLLLPTANISAQIVAIAEPTYKA